MAKNEADKCIKIEIWWLIPKIKAASGSLTSSIYWGKDGDAGSIAFEASLYGKPHVRLMYEQTNSYTGKKTECDYSVSLTTTRCNLGGVRHWFVCPFSVNGKYCGRRVAILYKDGNYFACRHCHSLTYRSRNRSRNHGFFSLMRAYDLVEKIDQLEETIKRKTYRGKPTKTQKRIDALSQKAGVAHALAITQEMNRRKEENEL